MTRASTNQHEYVDGQLRPTHAALFATFAADNDRAVVDGRPELDIAYGPHPRQTFDLFRTRGARRGLIGYFHAGYWQSRDKSGFRFLAPPLVADGFDVALINYPLSPEMCVAEIVEAAQASLETLTDRAEGAPVILVGHSAGAQIAVEIAMDARTAKGAVAGVLSISGVFDLTPLLGTSVNERLALDAAAAHAASPIHRVASGAPRAIFAVGALETAAFQTQTARMATAWAAAGNAQSHITVPDADHFSILSEVSREGGALRSAVRAFERTSATD